MQNTVDKTLIQHLDKTKTSAGSRLLKHYLNNPLTDLEELNYRHNVIGSFIGNFANNTTLNNFLTDTYDISRILGRIIYKSATPRDLYHLKKSLFVLPSIKEILYQYNSSVLTNIANKIDNHEELFTLLDNSITDLPPMTLKDGGVIKSGYNLRLDELRNLKRSRWQMVRRL